MIVVSLHICAYSVPSWTGLYANLWDLHEDLLQLYRYFCRHAFFWRVDTHEEPKMPSWICSHPSADPRLIWGQSLEGEQNSNQNMWTLTNMCALGIKIGAQRPSLGGISKLISWMITWWQPLFTSLHRYSSETLQDLPIPNSWCRHFPTSRASRSRGCPLQSTLWNFEGGVCPRPRIRPNFGEMECCVTSCNWSPFHSSVHSVSETNTQIWSWVVSVSRISLIWCKFRIRGISTGPNEGAIHTQPQCCTCLGSMRLMWAFPLQGWGWNGTLWKCEKTLSWER